MATLRRIQSNAKLEITTTEEPHDGETDIKIEQLEENRTTSKVRITSPKVSHDDSGDGEKAVEGEKKTSKVGLTRASSSNLKRAQSVSRVKLVHSKSKESDKSETKTELKIGSGASLKRSKSKVIHPASLSNIKRSHSTLKVKSTATMSFDGELNGEEMEGSSDVTGITTVRSWNTKDPSDPSYIVSEVGEFVEEKSRSEFKGREMMEHRKMKSKLFTLSEITWKEPDTLTQYSSEYGDADYEETDSLSCSFQIPRIRTESTEQIYLRDDASEMYNEVHGFTLVEHSEEDGFGKKSSRKFYPRIRQRIKSYKKMIPMKITYNKLSVDETGVVEEEDVVNEEMDVDETTNTILVKMKDEDGDEIYVEKDVTSVNIHDPSKKKKYLKLRMVNDEGEIVEELIELNDDHKRTNEIMKAAGPYVKRKPKDKSSSSAASGITLPEEQEREQAVSRLPSLAYADWLRDQNSQKSKMLHKAILNLKKAVDDQKMLKRLNIYLGKRLCQYYDLKGQMDPDFKYNERVGANNEERKTSYQNKLSEFDDVVNFIFSETKMRENWVTYSSLNLQKDVDNLTELRQKFYELEEAMVRDENPSPESMTHRTMTHQDIINQQKLMDANLSKVRLEYIKSQIILTELKEKEAAFQLSINQLEQVDFINYESMREKTKDLNDKLDLKEKQVMAMKDTITTRVQALAHVRLKTEHMSQENDKLKEEKQVIIEELNALRMEIIKVQQERRKLEKHLSKILEKEGLEKYPYLLKEAPTLGIKDVEQKQLLSDMVTKCSEMNELVQNKLEQHREKVKRYEEMKEKKRERNKLYSFEFK